MSDRVRESMSAYGAKVRPMSVSEYYRAAEKGVFRRGERLELIHGEVVQKVSPQLSRHAAVTGIVARSLEAAFGTRHHARIQHPLRLDDFNEPEPDVAIVVGREQDYLGRHPGPSDVKLAVEVSDSSIRFDRGAKARLYASFGIEEYWIVDLKAGRLEVYRDPSPEGYQTSQVLAPDESISPLGAPGHALQVDRLNPQPPTLNPQP